ncbi:MAG: hypothetical protein GVY24_05185 [Planctomycetes bacterium]|nr:hypothetical protein [Planctomycetota bacterium]
MKLPHRMLRNGWSAWHFAGAAAMAAFAVWMTFPAWRDIYLTAADPASRARHILLVPIIAAWLVWVRRHRMLHCRPRGHWIGLLLIFIGGFVFSLATRAEAQASLTSVEASPLWRMAWHAGTVAITVGGALTLLGWSVAKRFAPAVLVLIFLVPIPRSICEHIDRPVQVATLELTASVYNTIGMDAQIDYDLPTTTQVPRLTVNGVESPREAYHGLPMVFDLFLVSWAFVFGSPLRGSVRLIILLLSPVSAIVCGAVGLMATMWLYGSPNLLGSADLLHQIGSWLMLLVAFLLLTAVIRALAWASVPVRHYTLASDP